MIVFCFVVVVIMLRIWFLNKIFDEYVKEVFESVCIEVLLEGKMVLRYGFDIVIEVGIKVLGVIDFFKLGLKIVIDMWFVILFVVMSIGIIVIIIVNYMFFFVILGKFFVLFLELM